MKNVKFSLLLLLFGFCNVYALMTGSKHDLTSNKIINLDDVTSDSSDICTFCHTPHNTNSEFELTPLWGSKSTSDTTTYTVYKYISDENKTTFKSNDESINSSSSKACLSCHDGVSASNSIANTSTLEEGDVINIIETSVSSTAKISFDHPISVEFKGDGSILSVASLRDINAKLGGKGTWITPDDTNNIRSLLRGENNNMIECSSCHDPHLGDANTFLRTSITNRSNLCLGCHQK